MLDGAGAARLTHPEIAALVDTRFGGGPWWSQMVTVGYEQLRGLRAPHQKPGGFEISRSKTIAAPVGRVYRAWQSAAARRRWLADPGIDVSTARANTSLRFAWVDGTSRAEARFADKGGRTTVTVQHLKLRDAKAAERMKTYWGRQLDRLADYLAP